MLPGVAMTATRRRTMSAITDDTRLNRPSNQLYSTVTFWPSTQPPASLRPLRNALARRTEASADLSLTRATTGNGGCCARGERPCNGRTSNDFDEIAASHCSHIISRSEHIADNLATIRLVLDHQNALAHAASTCRSTMIGSENAKSEPRPGWDSTQIRPPCISMMRLDMASPRPVPSFLRVMALSACWNS